MRYTVSKYLTLSRSYLFFQVLRQGTMLFIAMLLAKSPLEVYGIGQYEQIWFMGGALSYFWMNGLQQGLLSYYPKLSAELQSRLLSIAISTYVGISALILAALTFFPGVFLPIFSGQVRLPFGGIALLFLFLHIPPLLTDTLYVLLKKPLELFAYGMVSFGLQAAVVLLPAFWGWGAEAIIKGLLGLSLFKALWLLGMGFRFGKLSLELEPFKHWWNASFHLMVYAAIGGYITVFNGWIVNWYYAGDELQFALFRYGARELPISLALAGGVNALIMQRAAEDLQSAMPEIRRRCTQLMHFLFPLTILLLITSRVWFTWLFSVEFIASLPVFNTFLLLIISRVIFSFPILNALQDKRIAIIGACSEAVFNVLLCLAFIPYWGLLGIALANFFAYGLEKIIYAVHLYRRYGISLDAYLNLSIWGIYALLLLLSWTTQIIWN